MQTETPLPPTLTLPPLSTQTPTPSRTPAPTLTPTPTLFLTPTETPENFALAESGYDIADVRITYPREDMMVINFKYRLDEKLQSKKARIEMGIPQRCYDAQYGLNYWAEDLLGEGQITFKMTLQGECSVESFEMDIWPLDENGYFTDAIEPVYRETIRQSYRVVRNFPTLNKDVLKVSGFAYRGTGEWSGVLTFDYSISDGIPIPPEEYYFEIRASGGDTCDFISKGPIITTHSGIYELPIDLKKDIYYGSPGCLTGFTRHSYSTFRLFLIDNLAQGDVDDRTVEFPLNIWKFQ